MYCSYLQYHCHMTVHHAGDIHVLYGKQYVQYTIKVFSFFGKGMAIPEGTIAACDLKILPGDMGKS